MTKKIEFSNEDEIDKELKEIKLQRERILLKRDLDREKRSILVSGKIDLMIIFLKNQVKTLIFLINFILRNLLKIIIFIIFLGLFTLGIYILDNNRAEIFQKEIEAHVNTTCGDLKFENNQNCSTDDSTEFVTCLLGKRQEAQNFGNCRQSARDNFIEKNKPFLIFQKNP